MEIEPQIWAIIWTPISRVSLKLKFVILSPFFFRDVIYYDYYHLVGWSNEAEYCQTNPTGPLWAETIQFWEVLFQSQLGLAA